MNNTQKYQLYTRIVDGVVLIVSMAIRWGVVLGVAVCLMVSFKALAGQQTNASIVVEMLGAIHADQWIAYIVAILSGAYGLNERRLRRNSIAELTAHSEELEKRLDPNRTSSSLTRQGTTPRERR